MSLFFAHITSKDPLQGFVLSADDLSVAIQCQFNSEEWEAIFGIKRGQGKFELPSCFVLDEMAADALDAAADLAFNPEGES